MAWFWEYKKTSDFGERVNPVTKILGMHKGTDYAVPLNTEIDSNVQGDVLESGYNSSRGNYVSILGDDSNIYTYQHLNKNSVSVGDKIDIGDVLGYSGSTGNSTGAHLHYEVIDKNGTPLDSANYAKILGNNPVQKTVDAVMNPNEWMGDFFKWLIIILLIVLFVLFLTFSLDIEVI